MKTNNGHVAGTAAEIPGKVQEGQPEEVWQAVQDINAQIKTLISLSRSEGEMAQEIAILEAIRNGFPAKRIAKGAAAEFFKLNDRKLEALIKQPWMIWNRRKLLSFEWQMTSTVK